MSSLNISISDQTRKAIDHRAAACGFDSAEAYVETLIDLDLQLEERGEIDRLLLEGLDSGPPVDATAQWWDRKAAELAGRARAANR
jgi:antitoxin ParD1/3/4